MKRRLLRGISRERDPVGSIPREGEIKRGRREKGAREERTKEKVILGGIFR